VDGRMGLVIEEPLDQRWMPVDGLKIVVDLKVP
jgi:hypothetical protein